MDAIEQGDWRLPATADLRGRRQMQRRYAGAWMSFGQPLTRENMADLARVAAEAAGLPIPGEGESPFSGRCSASPARRERTGTMPNQQDYQREHPEELASPLDRLGAAVTSPGVMRDYAALKARLAALLPIVTWVAEMDYRQAERAEIRDRARALLAGQGEAQRDA